MPELPEVETVVRELQEKLVGKKITAIIELRKNILQSPLEDFQKKFHSKKILKIFRYGKYIFFDIFGDYFLIVHLRMTGKLIYPATSKNPYNRVLFVINKTQNLAFNDVRCFGTIDVFPKNKSFIKHKKLGIDALDKRLTTKVFFSMLQNKKRILKNFLLDQSEVAGIGNIYVCEILYKAQISPFCATNSLSHLAAKKLLAHTKKILKLAICHNGTSISDYRRIDNKTGEFQNFLQVYGKQGQKCATCSKKIQRKKQSQSTYYCPHCQPE
jgi:formamidopyrimidine-DNA glycosylase